MPGDNDAVKLYVWLWAVWCFWFHSSHHKELPSTYYHCRHIECTKCDRVWVEEDY